MAQAKFLMSDEEYLAFERASESRHEYLDGQIYAMAGESPEHSTICFNLAAILKPQIRKKNCRGFSPNMKVQTSRSGLYSYPDAMVVCGEPIFLDKHRDVLLNPKVIIEVLSPSTESYDRGRKFFRYQKIKTLSDYLLIAQDEPLIEHFARLPNQRWELSFTSELADSVHITSIDCLLPMAEVYDQIVLPAIEEETAPKRTRGKTARPSKSRSRKR